jgi:hypothetical protein
MLWTFEDITKIEINSMENGQIWGFKRYYYELPLSLLLFLVHPFYI